MRSRHRSPFLHPRDFIAGQWRCLLWLSLAAMPVLWHVPSLHAMTPSVERVHPLGAQRGATVDLEIKGVRLSEPLELMFYRNGVARQEIRGRGSELVEARITLSSDCTLGQLSFRLRTKFGVSELHLLSVAPYPVVAESEPNSDIEDAQTVTSGGCTIEGVLADADVDFFHVSLQRGERLSAEIHAMRLGAHLVDPYLAILDADGRVLAEADDTPLLKQDAFVSIHAPADGTYFVQARESAFGGDDLSRYLLHIGSFPRPRGIFPLGAPPQYP